MQVRIKKLHDDVKLPIKGSSHAACFDVYAHDIDYLGDGKVKVKLGFSTEIPDGYKGVIVPRSNITKHHWVINNQPAQIDSDYRGEWMIVFTSLYQEKYNPFPYSVGERVAQIYFDREQVSYFVEVEELEETERGIGSFGSTGLR